MARTGLTKAQVREMRDRLLAEGAYPSADAVRRALGDTGSKSTIHRYLKELADEGEGAGQRRDDAARQLQVFVEQLAERLHAQAEQRVRAQLAAHELALRRKDEELTALRRQVALLSARLERMEDAGEAAQAPVPRERAAPRTGTAIGGFGNFGGYTANTRCGQRDDSAFNIVLAGGRAAVVDAKSVRPEGFTLP